MSRKLLAKHAGISERYITQLESGKGNISIVLLQQVATALGLPLSRLLEQEPASPELTLVREFVGRLTPEQLREAYAALSATFGEPTTSSRSRRIALVGLRGAGKTTLGTRLGKVIEVPFIELDREIERIAGVSIAHIIDLYGQPAYRRYEMQALQELLTIQPRFVVATGGSLVAEPATYELLLRTCFTVWVRTTPEEHMSRVIAQGDQRPMAGSSQAMDDLRRILREREPLYARADVVVETTATSVQQSVAEITRALPAVPAQ